MTSTYIGMKWKIPWCNRLETELQFEIFRKVLLISVQQESRYRLGMHIEAHTTADASEKVIGPVQMGEVVVVFDRNVSIAIVSRNTFVSSENYHKFASAMKYTCWEDCCDRMNQWIRPTVNFAPNPQRCMCDTENWDKNVCFCDADDVD